MGKAYSKLGPEAVLDLQKRTHFDKKEIQTWYQAFLKDCPTGIITKERFLQMYDNFFPFGDSSAFAGHMFRVYDTEGTGNIKFGEYLEALSIITRGRIEEKLNWAFRLYDSDGDGQVSRTDMITIVDAIYRMISSLVEFAEDEDTPSKRVEKTFRLMGKEDANALSMDEFREGVQADSSAIQALLLYDGVV